MKVTMATLDLETRHPFGISRRTEKVFRNVIVEMAHEGLTGIGEAAPSEFYGENRDTVLGAVSALAPALGDDIFLMEDAGASMAAALGRNPAARAALDIALHDLVAKALGVPLYRLLGLNPASAPPTSYTISLGDPGLLRAKLEEAKNFPCLKVKVGTGRDVETLAEIRSLTDKKIRIDANGAWSPKEAVSRIRELERFDIELVEQPVPATDIDGLRFVRERVDAPVIADESAVTVSDLPGLRGAVDGINIKLMKCGGIREAVKMVRVARALEMKVMIGCMIESSIAITAAAHIAPLVDFADLDGNLLVDRDPYRGVTTMGGHLVLPERPGLGVEPA